MGLRNLCLCPALQNTKVLFKYLPHDEDLRDPTVHLPAMAHMNYHPEKEPRMQSTIAFYREKDASALKAWNVRRAPLGVCAATTEFRLFADWVSLAFLGVRAERGATRAPANTRWECPKSVVARRSPRPICRLTS